MKLIQVEGVYVLGYATADEAQAAILVEENKLTAAPTAAPHESIVERFEKVWAHLKSRGIDASQPVPEDAEEVPTPEGTSTSHETIVPTETPVAYVPIPRQAKAAPSGPGEDEPEVVGNPEPETAKETV